MDEMTTYDLIGQLRDFFSHITHLEPACKLLSKMKAAGFSRMPIFPGPMARPTASSVPKKKWAFFSQLPPYSSVRMLEQPVKNCGEQKIL
jgi:hypothetical protein